METISIPIDQLIKEAPDYTISELADRYCTDYGTIYRILSRYKVSAAKAYEPITKEVLEVIFEEPRTLQEAASMLYTTPSTIGMALKRHGLVGNKKITIRSTFSGERAFRVLGYLIKNPEESMASIGKKFNCTREYVRQIKECAIKEEIIKKETETNEQQ